jgi:hypothetical protein
MLTTWHVGSNYADKRRSLGRYNPLEDLGHGVLAFGILGPVIEVSSF